MLAAVIASIYEIGSHRLFPPGRLMVSVGWVSTIPGRRADLGSQLNMRPYQFIRGGRMILPHTCEQLGRPRTHHRIEKRRAQPGDRKGNEIVRSRCGSCAGAGARRPRQDCDGPLEGGYIQSEAVFSRLKAISNAIERSGVGELSYDW